MRVRATLTFDGALALLRGNRDHDLQQFIFQEARKELTTNDQTALRALSFFAPSATFEAWTQVAELSRNALETTVDRLSALSLVDILTGEERYALHPLTRNFVRDELLADVQIAREIGMRFAEHWVAYAKRYGGEDKESYKTYDRLEAEWSNLDAAAEWLWQTADVQEEAVSDEHAARRLSDLAGALRQFFWFGGRWDERMELSAYAYEGMCALKEWSKAGWHAYDAAWIFYNRDDIDEATRWTDRSVQVWKEANDKWDEAMGIRMQGILARQGKDYDAAKRFFEESLAIFRNINSEGNVVMMLNDLGGLERRHQQYDAAESYYREALVLAEKLTSIEKQAYLSGNLGLVAFNRERLAEAREWYEKELSLVQEVGRQDLIAAAKQGLARVHEKEGYPDLALPLALEALAIYERLRHRNLKNTRELVKRLVNKVDNG